MPWPRFVPRLAAALVVAASLTSCTASSKPKPAPRPPSQEPTPAPTPAPFPALVPLPVSVRPGDGAPFAVSPATAIFVQSPDPRAMFVAEFLAGLLTTVGPVGPSVTQMGASIPEGSVVLSLDLDPAAGEEAYDLSVASTGVSLKASSPAGLFYGVQTLRQILPPILEHDAARPRPIAIPPVRITDRPRFAWRGAMLDVARHFFGVEDVKRYLDLLALHKMNRLHLHLSDDQGWRIEIKSWPNLTAMGARSEVGGTVGGFYTQEQYKEIVAYARERFIDIVPEIDMPGHTNAALSSYPELNCDGVAPPPYTDIKVGFSCLCVSDERTYGFIDDVVREISALTPGPFFHAGGDEVKKLTDADYAQFINRVQDIVERHGKRLIGWDEVALAALHPASVIQHWRPGTALGAAAAKGSKLIMSPANRAYLDMQYDPASFLGLFWAGRIEVRDAYSWDPATLMEGVGEGSVLGVEAPLWTETLATIREVESMAFPRLAAIAEVAWSPQAARGWDDFKIRLGGQGPRWQAMGVNFYRSPQVPWRP
ncbi:MAG: beta-N-acetylhexosaminidase [Vicinamibacteria bacterium]|nr:beta-N-acetylhexosaminidase [Vicinamibacteria bacterium]